MARGALDALLVPAQHRRFDRLAKLAPEEQRQCTTFFLPTTDLQPHEHRLRGGASLNRNGIVEFPSNAAKQAGLEGWRRANKCGGNQKPGVQLRLRRSQSSKVADGGRCRSRSGNDGRAVREDAESAMRVCRITRRKFLVQVDGLHKAQARDQYRRESRDTPLPP